MPPAAATYPHSRIGTALWVAIFFGCSGLYVVAHFTLQTVAFFKVFTNKVGEWTVTQRGANPASREPVTGNLYGLDVLHRHQAMLEEMQRACEIQDLPFDGVVKESAPSQYEFNMQHVDSQTRRIAPLRPAAVVALPPVRAAAGGGAFRFT